MADPRWTDETLKAARTASFDPGHFTPRDKVRAEDDFEPEALWAWQARAVLAALAEAGLLLPPGGEVEWGVRSRVEYSWVPTLPAPSEERARVYAEQRVTRGGYAEAQVMRRVVGPWVEVPDAVA